LATAVEERRTKDRPWLAAYPAGVPAEIDAGSFASIRDILARSCREYATKPAFTNMGRTLSYADLDRLSRDFGAWLQKGIGLPRGARVAIMMPNLLQYPVALFGALRAGYVVVNCNPLYTPRELEHQLADSGAEAIVILENFAHTLAAVLPKTPVRHVVTTQLGDMLGFPRSLLVNFVVKRVKKLVRPFELPGAVAFSAALAAGRGAELDEPPLAATDLAFLQYTGGTTGVSKGAMLTHGNIVANLLQARAWIGPFLDGAHREVIITPLPLYHILSLTANCLVFMTLGGENVLIPNPRDIPGFIKEMSRYRFTAITGVNTLFNALLNRPEFAKLDFSSLRLTLGGGMAVFEAVAKRWKEVTGCTLLEAYGLTETSPAATINPFNLADYNGSIGLPIPSTDIDLRDDAGRSVALGEPGEICIKGPQVMAGYWNRPDETAKVMTPDGFFMTGDIGIMDARGYIRIVDRKKDMILVSGFNVYPNEIESVVVQHAGVLECAAVGVPDRKSGEAVKLFIVKRDPALTAEDVLAHCRANLTGYKCPRDVEFRTELPKSNVGKILRRELRDEARKAAAATA